MVDLIEQSRMAVDELIDVAGRATIEAVLQLSAEQVAGPRTPGQRRMGLLWHGRQAGRVCLKERKLGVTKPRLREKSGGEVAIPAYEAMQENGMSQRMLEVLMRGISTRQYAAVLPEMASTCGVSKSTVSREAAEAGEEALNELLERHFDAIDVLVIYIDGMQFGEPHVISAVGVDRAGHKHVLGMRQGATENAAAVEDLLGQLVARGVDPEGQALVRDRRRQSVAGCDLQSVWNAASGAALPQSQDPQRVRPTARRTERSRQGGDARQLQAGGEGRHGAAEKAGGLAGAGMSGCSEQFAGRAGGMFYDQSLGHSTVAASLPGHDQSDRESAVGRAHANPAHLPLAGCWHRPALGGSFLSGDGEKLPPHNGLEGSLATGDYLRKESK